MTIFQYEVNKYVSGCIRAESREQAVLLLNQKKIKNFKLITSSEIRDKKIRDGFVSEQTSENYESFKKGIPKFKWGGFWALTLAFSPLFGFIYVCTSANRTKVKTELWQFSKNDPWHAELIREDWRTEGTLGLGTFFIAFITLIPLAYFYGSVLLGLLKGFGVVNF